MLMFSHSEKYGRDVLGEMGKFRLTISFFFFIFKSGKKNEKKSLARMSSSQHVTVMTLDL